ncbi:hypothetical protein FJZ36_15465, partial [Candidatus Poribacteria bacterium]|nr:hypothetical protein [Candidatus Poribacteria bacterium]
MSVAACLPPRRSASTVFCSRRMASPPNSQSAHRKSLAQNALSLFGAHFIGKVLSFGLIVFLPRFVSDEELGAYFVANAVTSLVGVLAELGMRDPLIRELHLRPERSAETLGVAFAFRATMSLVVLATCGLAVWVGGYTGLLANLIWLLGGAEVFNGFAQLFYMVFRARERMDYESICVLVERATVVGIGGGLVAAGTGRMSLFGAVALGAAVANAAIAGGYVIGRFSRFGPSFAWSRWRWFVGLLGPFALANILNLIYFRIDTILLERWSARSHQAVAWYGIAYSWVMALTIFPGAVMGAAFPHLARLSAPDAGGDASDALAALYRRAWKVLLSAGVPIAVVTATCAPRLMRFFYPAELYPPGTVDAALRILA